MDNSVIVAVVSGIFTLLGSFGGVMATSRLTAYRLQKLEEKVDKHNQVIDRVYRLEKHDAVLDEEIKAANHRIGDLERAEK
ncbi:MAG: hemolysin XhlA family protein [Oscillospiraceae bacterium]|nr:hemolysin XhlA family protein [Oscillospiraceae bacterium]